MVTSQEIKNVNDNIWPVENKNRDEFVTSSK